MKSPDLPDVSVTLLTRNAGTLLDRLLDAVQRQETDRRVEVVAVDSQSNDGTRECLEAHGARVVTFPGDSFDFGRARDLVFESSAAPIVIAISQDAIPAHAQWLEKLVEPLAQDDVAVSCGRSIPDPQRHYPQFLWERNGCFYFTREMRAFRDRYGRGISNANAAYKREVWARLRFGDQPIGEDFRFQTKLRDTGLRIAFPDDATVLHHHAYSLGTLYKRCRNEGFGLRALGCPYSASDLAGDLVKPAIVCTWIKELFRGRITSAAALLFPIVRPLGVYAGSRFARELSR